MSHRKAKAARANGALSHGPVTYAGKQKCAQNSTRHGLAGRTLVLHNEDPAAFQAMLDAYTSRFAPADDVEADLVAEIAAARWRLRRIWAFETATLDLQMTRQEADVRREFAVIDEAGRGALAFQALSGSSPSLANLHRYETRYSRIYHRAIKTLLDLQSRRPVPPGAVPPQPEKQNVRNEPTSAQLPPPQPLAATDSAPSASPPSLAPSASSASLASSS